jgi:ribosome-binding ATPase YchF (GTP1/OBG family)
LAHVLRVFDDPAVPHPAGSVDPLRDAVSLDLELMLSDLEQIERRIERVEKDLKKKKEASLELEHALLLRCQAAIQSETPLRELQFSPEEKKALTGFMFLSLRPMLCSTLAMTKRRSLIPPCSGTAWKSSLAVRRVRSSPSAGASKRS